MNLHRRAKDVMRVRSKLDVENMRYFEGGDRTVHRVSPCRVVSDKGEAENNLPQ